MQRRYLQGVDGAVSRLATSASRWIGAARASSSLTDGRAMLWASSTTRRSAGAQSSGSSSAPNRIWARGKSCTLNFWAELQRSCRPGIGGSTNWTRKAGLSRSICRMTIPASMVLPRPTSSASR